jgi:basic amino acid/polyamine antiporter, APA family
VSLVRRLGVTDAVVLGLGSMLGAGVFVVFAPATELAGGGGMLLAILVAGAVAFCNANSSAALAARYPESGGSYVYGRERLGAFPGFLAGWAFVVGKTASCAAMALTIGFYLVPEHANTAAVLVVAALTAVNLFGVSKTARVTRWLVALTLLTLAIAVGAGLLTGEPSAANLGEIQFSGVLAAAGLLFFAFAGYARVATLGEEVRDPQRTIPRAIPLALGLVLVTYLVVGAVTLAVLGPDRLATATAPVAALAGSTPVAPVIRAGAVIAVVSVLLALLAGVARTVLAMARRRDLPVVFAAVAAQAAVPARAQVLVGACVAVPAALGDIRAAIGFSACTVLVYYAITNAAAWTLGRDRRAGLGVRPLAALGLIGCLGLALSLPWRSVVAGFGVLAVGAVAYAVRRRSDTR